MRREALFYISANLFSDLAEESKHLKSPVFSLSHYTVLAEVYIKKNPDSHRYEVRKRSTLITFSGNTGYSSLLLHQNKW